ncbi:hypothetical protein ABB37_02354 [Leptomonas pyrrhocoris]|uniref:RRM domain-containing protein n=1 Tax=Leptomonas pyrrhocoris TaxID=157538 RepID=A0A0M9G829_LEPPY|nr:hypothetical protein ABB37_02354 [Leptomonas pyrrhocoris]KPA84359.1 hypothetical protein ABB37_02354 [Leptomonas pyrrhocoris]|eukprot:XP_015662798.1 hypothetical protein ABB37_02354 [Leptomonas pyrrhocoris]
MFVKPPRSISPAVATADPFNCRGERSFSDAAVDRTARLPFSAFSVPCRMGAATGAEHMRTERTFRASAAVTESQPEPQQSSSDSTGNSNASLWRPLSRVTTPFEVPSPPLTDACGNNTAATGVVWVGCVPPSRVRELSPLIHLLKGVRSTGAEAPSQQPSRQNLDFAFFVDGPYEGQGFLCFSSAKEAEEAVRRCPGVVVVGQQEPLLHVSVRVSSVEEMTAAQQQHQQLQQCHATHLAPALTPTLPPSSTQNLVYWLRGLPFQAQRSDVEAFLRGVWYLRLDIGVLGSGECSGNAFVELNGSKDQDALQNLHNTFIPCAAHAAVPALNRPKPRFVEVILTTADRRQEQLSIDRCMVRNQLPHHLRMRVPATKIASSSSPSFSASRYVGDRGRHHQQQPQQISLPRQYFSGSDSYLSSGDHSIAASVGTAAAPPMPPVSPSFFLMPSGLPPHRIEVAQGGSNSFSSSGADHNAGATTPARRISPAEALSMMSAQPLSRVQLSPGSINPHPGLTAQAYSMPCESVSLLPPPLPPTPMLPPPQPPSVPLLPLPRAGVSYSTPYYVFPRRGG